MNKIFKRSLLGMLLLGIALSAGAAVEVRFVAPEKFRDAGESAVDRERALEGLEAHIRALAEKHVPASQRLVIEVLDVNLAGEVEPYGRTMERIRVLRPVTWPSLELRYTLSEGGAMLREGKARLQDMNYQSSMNRYFDSESQRYEKQLLDDWFAKEFPVAGKP